MEHLSSRGRSAIIVPEGIIFQEGTAYQSLRKQLIETSLTGVISLPAGIFQPYSGVKTSLLILDKERNKKQKNIFIGIINFDGFTLTSSRKENSKNDLEKILLEINNFYQGKKIIEKNNFFLVDKNDILKNSSISFSYNNYEEEKNYKSIGNNIKLEKLIEESRTRYNNEKRNIWSVSNKQGFVNPDKLFSHQIASDDIKNYKIIEKNYFAYNPSRINVGSIALNQSNEIGFVSPMYVVFRNLNEKILNNNFLFYLLKSEIGIKKFKDNSIGTVRNTLKFNNLINIQIPLPPIDEQNKIVEEFDNYQKIIDGCKQIIENYKPSFLNKVTWKEFKIKDIATLSYGLGEAALEDGKFRFIRITDINEHGLLKDKDKKYIDIKKDEKKYILQKEDVLIARTGATYGKCLFFESDEPSVYAGYLIKFEFETFWNYQFNYLFNLYIVSKFYQINF
jgi:type I restriction enzyme M protein